VRTAILTRDPATEFGMFSTFRCGSFYCYGLEHPDLCIPVGEYLCKRIESPKFSWTYEVTGVEGRTHILFHWGNFAGADPHKSDSDGCILLGNAIGQIAGVPALLGSRDAFYRFMADLEGDKEFNLLVTRAE